VRSQASTSGILAVNESTTYSEDSGKDSSVFEPSA
jgi:hypothetical protein